MAFLYTLLGLVVFILVLGTIVIIHEGGHFLFSKKAGILCHEFSVGMGPLICSKKKGETRYSLRAIPLGGYVSMAGEEVDLDLLKDVEEIKIEFDDNNRVKTIILNVDNKKYANLEKVKLISYDLIGTKDALDDELYIEVSNNDAVTRYVVNRDAMVNYQKQEELQIAPYDRTFANKKWGQRFMSVFAGPLMNFVLALVIFFMMGLFFGYADTSSTVVSDVSGAAELAGITDEDKILSINGVELTDWNDLSNVLADCATGNINYDGSLNVSYLHDEEVKSTIVKPIIYILSAQMVVSYKDGYVVLAEGDWINDTKFSEDGLLSGDKITALNDTQITGIDDVLEFFTSDSMDSAQDVRMVFNITRDGVTRNLPYTISVYSKEMLSVSGYNQTKVIMGVSTGTKVDIVKLLYMPWVQTGEASVQIINTLKLLFTKSSGVSILDLSGPVGIFNLFTSLVQGKDAVYNILYWAGLISVNIGVVNLLPLPALDGGRIAFLLYEAITKKKATPKVENTIHNIGFVLLMVLFVVIFISDIVKCFI